MLSPEYIEGQRLWLLARLESKSEILKQGGERASLHSPRDIIKINFALLRVEEGQYGLCTNCGSLIGEQRLSFQPETPFCADCQVKVEAQNNSARI